MNGPGRRVAAVRDEVAAALPAIVGRHLGPAALEHAFPLPGGRREKAVLRVRGFDSPFVLRIYGPRERAALENGLIAGRAIEGRGGAPVAHCCGAAPEAAPFPYRLHDFLWGTDAEKLLASGALGPAEKADVGAALGEAAAALHELSAEGYGEPRLEPKDRAGRLSAFVEAEVERLAAAAPEAASRELRDLAARAAPLLDARESRPRLTHRRFDPAAILLRREEGRYVLSGILALDEARFFDPAWDLLALEEDLFAREPSLREPFARAYAERMGALPAWETERAALYRAMRALSCAAPAKSR
jgi:hypothetical protein